MFLSVVLLVFFLLNKDTDTCTERRASPHSVVLMDGREGFLSSSADLQGLAVTMLCRVLLAESGEDWWLSSVSVKKKNTGIVVPSSQRETSGRPVEVSGDVHTKALASVST